MITFSISVIIVIAAIIGLINRKDMFVDGLCCGIILMACFSIVTTYIDNMKPSAIDVYQNKTILKINYKNGVPVDSIVVFKDKEK